MNQIIKLCQQHVDAQLAQYGGPGTLDPVMASNGFQRPPTRNEPAGYPNKKPRNLARPPATQPNINVHPNNLITTHISYQDHPVMKKRFAVVYTFAF